jgi:hypothetical protein
MRTALSNVQVALAVAEDSAEAKPKGSKKKKKKATKKKMTKEEAIAAAHEAQAAAAAALLKGVSHEDAAKAAEATLQVRLGSLCTLPKPPLSLAEVQGIARVTLHHSALTGSHPLCEGLA